jgi:hypothetical protein
MIEEEDNESLRKRLDQLRSEDRELEFGNPEIKLDKDKDQLDQMIERTVFLHWMHGDASCAMKQWIFMMMNKYLMLIREIGISTKVPIRFV